MKKQTFEQKAYEGLSPSTLCVGCGHDQISRHLIQAFYEAQVDPFQVAKISGIGCSSKTPDYFLKLSQGFNTAHGRMSSVATGVKLANRNLKVIGVSGDGDTGNIGLGPFLHTVNKDIPMLYIVENNGVYGLTKGQFSATAKEGSHLKSTGTNVFPNLDLCKLVLSAGCGFVARTLSSDKKQLVSLLKLALHYEGFAFLDVISPCVAYGNDKGFSHSFSSMKENSFSLNELDLLEDADSLSDSSSDSSSPSIPAGKGFRMVLKNQLENYDVTDRKKAMEVLEEGKEMARGLIYHSATKTNFFEKMNVVDAPLISLKEEETRLSPENLKEIMELFA